MVVKETDSLKYSISFLNAEAEEKNKANVKSKDKIEEELVKLRLKLLNYEVYNRRENVRFYGIPEGEEENTKNVLYEFLEQDLGIDKARDIEFQRVHRTGKRSSSSTKPRPILARCLRYTDRELIFPTASAHSVKLPKKSGHDHVFG